MILYLCISAVIRLKSPPSEVTKQVDWESVINLVFVYLRPTPGPTNVPTHHPPSSESRKLLYFSAIAHDCIPTSFHPILATNHMNHNYWNISGDLWTFFQQLDDPWENPITRSPLGGAIVLETIWLRGELAKTALLENELPLRSAVVPPAPDPKCFPTPSILRPF